MVSISLRDQLIKSINFQFGEQCRKSLSSIRRDEEAKQGRLGEGGRENASAFAESQTLLA
jgi:hypothetical protein